MKLVKAFLALCVIGALAGLALMWAYGVIGLPYTRTGPVQIAPGNGTAPEVRTVLVLGTSLSSRGTWVEVLDAQLAECNVAVEKRARGGASSTWGLKALAQWYDEGNTAGLVIIEFSGNDASPINGMPLYKSVRQTRALIEMAQDNGAQVSLATMSPGWAVNALERPGQNRYHASYRDLAGNGVGLIDSIEMWRAIPKAQRKVLVPDDLHPTDAAAIEITVPLFEEHIRDVFCE